jgi:hypothetical protein
VAQAEVGAVASAARETRVRAKTPKIKLSAVVAFLDFLSIIKS